MNWKYVWKTNLGKMLIEHTIEFELRGLDLLLKHVLLKPVVFMTKQKSPR